MQPAIITECFIAQTIADFLSLEQFVDADEKKENIPRLLLFKLMSFKGVLETSIPRYIYYNEKSTTILLQYGDSSSIDAIIIHNKFHARIEFKEQNSKFNEIDISGLYNENGFLLIDDKFQEKYKDYIKYIQIFNEQTNIFQESGHNFNISEYLNQNDLKYITEKFFNAKNIDLFILQQKNYIYPILSKDLINNIDISGSEIRTAGRNHLKVFTPKFAKEVIYSLNGTITENQKVKLPISKITKPTGRNISKSTRCKFHNLLFVRLENTTQDSNFIYFSFDDIRQLKPTISLHLNVKIDETNLKNRYLELNNK